MLGSTHVHNTENPPTSIHPHTHTLTILQTHTTPVHERNESLCWELHAFPITTDGLTDCPNTLEREVESLVGNRMKTREGGKREKDRIRLREIRDMPKVDEIMRQR